MAWDYTKLNLRGSKVQTGGSIPAGRYVMVVTAAKLDTVKGWTRIIVSLADKGGMGATTDQITVHAESAETNQKHATAVRIGEERLMGLLTYGGHPNPEAHNDIAELVGLVVGVQVEQRDDYIKDGEKRKGGTGPVKRGAAYFNPSELGYAHDPNQPRGMPASSDPDLDDEIPF